MMKHNYFNLKFFIMLISAYLLMGCYLYNERTPRKYLLPKGYVGWIRIDHIEGLPLPPTEDGFYVLKIPANGILQIAPIGAGWARDKFYYYSEQGIEQVPFTLIRNGLGVTHAPEDKPLKFSGYGFAGTDEEIIKFGGRMGSDGYPLVGNVHNTN